jgi:hypothetical protein
VNVHEYAPIHKLDRRANAAKMDSWHTTPPYVDGNSGQPVGEPGRIIESESGPGW